MREIRFRAWNIDKKEMFDFDFADYWMEDIELMQFTGLKDKNGKEIYEGDIVRDFFDALCVIKWIVWLRGSGFVAEPYTAGIAKIDTSDLKNFAQEMARSEIIGNIYENPELFTK